VGILNKSKPFRGQKAGIMSKLKEIEGSCEGLSLSDLVKALIIVVGFIDTHSQTES
jgi:hypothetical protein